MNKRKLPPLNGGKYYNPSKFDDDIYRNDRLLQFNLPEIKKRRHYTFLKQKASSVNKIIFSPYLTYNKILVF